MELDKTHLDQFENIAPPMKDALTLPVGGVGMAGVSVYVCTSPFNTTTKRLDRDAVLTVAKGLVLLESDEVSQLLMAASLLREVPGGHGYTIDTLESIAARTR